MPPKVTRSTAAASEASSDTEDPVPTPPQIVMMETQLVSLVERLTRSQAEANHLLVESIVSSGRVTPSSPSTAPTETRTVVTPSLGTFARCSARFSGGAANDDEVLEAFIDSIEVFQECTNISNEHALRGLPMLLEGDAAIWWQGAKPTISTWQGAIEGLRSMFGVPRPAHLVFRDIFSSEQKDSEKSGVFINRVRAKLAKLRYKLLEETQIDIVYGLLCVSIKERLQNARP